MLVLAGFGAEMIDGAGKLLFLRTVHPYERSEMTTVLLAIVMSRNLDTSGLRTVVVGVCAAIRIRHGGQRTTLRSWPSRTRRRGSWRATSQPPRSPSWRRSHQGVDRARGGRDVPGRAGGGAACATLDLLARLHGHIGEKRDVRVIRDVADLSSEELDALETSRRRRLEGEGRLQ
jgi:hypothetical protein